MTQSVIKYRFGCVLTQVLLHFFSATSRFFIFDLTNSGVVFILILQWDKTINSMDNSTTDLVLLEQKVSELIAFCQQLKDENSKLKQKIADSELEREQLLNNNEVASEQVRAVIERLQSLGKID